MNATLTLWRKYLLKSVLHMEEILGFLLQPVLWVVLFGVGMESLFGSVLPGGGDYITFMVPGIVTLTVVSGAIGGGSTWLTERIQGIVKEYMVAPISRTSILLGNALSIVTRVLIQSLIIILVGILLGARLSGNPLDWLSGLVLVGGFGLGFTGIALAMASMTDSPGGYHSIIFILNLPLLFLSNALYPLETLPTWMRVGALANPTTYVIAGLRETLLQAAPLTGQPDEIPLWLSFVVVLAFAAAGMALAVRAFQRTIK
jgi:ABC-2 type transport system permease protein